MDEKLKSLYNSYIENGILSNQTTFEQFSQSDENTIQSLHQQGIDKKVLSPQTNIETFRSAFFLPQNESEDLVSTTEEVTTTVDSEAAPMPQPSVSLDSEITPTETIDEVEVVDKEKKAQRISQIDNILSESFKVTSPIYQLEKSTDIPSQVLDTYAKEIMMADNDVAAEGLQKIYRNFGFSFTDTGFGEMKVSSKDGKEITIDTDTFTEDGAIEEAGKLKKFLNDNKSEFEDITFEKMHEATKGDSKDFIRYYDEDLINESIKNVNSQLKDFQENNLTFQDNVKQFEIEKSKLQDQYRAGELSIPEFNQAVGLLSEVENKLILDQEKIKEQSGDILAMRAKLTEVTGEHVALEAQKGNWITSWWKSAVNTFDSKNTAITGGIIDIVSNVLLEEGLESLLPLKDETGEIAGKREGETDFQFRDRVSKRLKSEIKPMIRTALQDEITGGVTNEYQEEFQKTTWGMVSTAMVEMVAHAASTGGRPGLMATSFGLQIHDNVYKEMEAIEEFKDVPELEKSLVATLVGVTSGILESFGVSKVLNKSGISKGILTKVLSKVAPKATYNTIENLIELEVKNIIAKGGIKTITAGLVEAETEVLQLGSEASIKSIYNSIKDKELFDDESTIKGITLAKINQAAKLGFLAGGGIGSIAGGINAFKQNKINKLNDEQFKLVESLIQDPTMRQSFIDNLKIEITQNETNKSKAQKAVDNMNEMVSILQEIPDDIDIAGRKEAVTLIQEKRAIEKSIQGKSESLTSRERNRISDIDTRLSRIGATKTTTEPVAEVVEEEVVTPEVTEEILVEGKLEVDNLTEGSASTTKPIKIYKGIGGKKDLKGFRINAHEGAEGVFSAVDKSLAEEYGKEEGIAEIILPEGTTVEVVEIDGKGMTLDEYRAAEVEAINNSDAQVVKLRTVDGVMKKGAKKQDQYIIKDETLIQELSKPKEEVKTPEITEEEEEEEIIEEAPSKKRVDNIVDEIITKVEGRNFGEDTNPEVILESVQGYLQGSKFYEEATDIERENSVIAINEKLGIKIPKAPSVAKILGKPKRKKIVVDEMASLKDQIRLESRAAKGAVKAYKDISKSIIEDVKKLSKKGVITPSQTSAIIKKVLSTNMMNPVMVDRLNNYIDSIYKKAELADKINKSKGKLKQAKKNLKEKIGASPDLQPVLEELFAIDPSLIPLDKFDSYFEILESFGQRKKVLSLPQAGEVMDIASDIINSVDTEVNEEVKESLPSKLNEEIESDLDGYLNDIISNKASLENTYNERGRELGKYLNELSKEDLIGLIKEKKDGTKDYSNLENLKLIKENIANGYIPKFAMDLKILVESNNSSKEIDNVVSKVKETSILTGFSRLYGKLKGLITGKSKMTQSLRGTPTFYIDDLLGNFNSKTIWDNTLGKLGKLYSAFQTDLAKNVSSKVEAADSLLYKTKVPTIQRMTNAVQKSKYKIMAYRLQREFESNPGSKQVASAIDFINETINSVKKEEGSSKLNKQDLKILEEIKKEFSVDGEISLDKINKSFTSNEKKALKLLDEVNEYLESKAIFTSSVLRGDKIKPINNYVHHSVIMKDKETELSKKTDKMVKPSTKAGTLRERTPGAKAINFDPISSTLSGATETLLDYHMTEGVKTVNASIAKAKDKIFENEESTEIAEESINALQNVVNEVLSKTFGDSFVQYDTGSSLVKKMQKLGYQAALASIPRAGAELGSNMIYALTVNPKGFTTGVKDYGSFSMGNEGISAMENLGSSETMKLYDTKNMTGKMADSNILYEGAPKASRTLTPVVEKAKYLSQFTGVKQIGKFAKSVGDNLISTPDKMISRPLWFGNFADSFKKETGIKLTSKDFQEIAEGKSKYLGDKYKSAVEKSTKFADEQTVKMASSTNPFNVIPKNLISPKESVFKQVYKIANSYMSRFSQYEYAAARNAIVSMFKSGNISKSQATSALIGITTRMASYVVLYSVLSSAFDSLFGIEEEEEDVESLIKRQLIGAPLSLMTGRGLGNLPKVPINYALEMINDEYLEDLRDGKEYDPYEHSIVFSQVTQEDLEKKSPEELFLYLMSGPFSPLAKSTARAFKVITKSQTSAKPETREKYKKELLNRISIEALGNFGMIPFYKDIRRIIVKDMFKDIDKREGENSDDMFRELNFED